MALPFASEFLACDGSFRPSTSSAILSLAYGLSSSSSLLLVLCERGSACWGDRVSSASQIAVICPQALAVLS
jgi:hypothetical protein